MNVVWVNQDITHEHNGALAYDDIYGVDSDLIETVEVLGNDGDTEVFLVSGNGDYTLSWYQDALQDFVSALDRKWADHPNLQGDFWPDGVGNGEGYDVSLLKWSMPLGHPNIHIYRLTNDQ